MFIIHRKAIVELLAPDFRLSFHYPAGTPTTTIWSLARGHLLAAIQALINSRSAVPPAVADIDTLALGVTSSGKVPEARFISIPFPAALKVAAYSVWHESGVPEARLARAAGLSRSGLRNIWLLSVSSTTDNVYSILRTLGHNVAFRIRRRAQPKVTPKTVREISYGSSSSASQPKVVMAPASDPGTSTDPLDPTQSNRTRGQPTKAEAAAKRAALALLEIKRGRGRPTKEEAAARKAALELLGREVELAKQTEGRPASEAITARTSVPQRESLQGTSAALQARAGVRPQRTEGTLQDRTAGLKETDDIQEVAVNGELSPPTGPKVAQRQHLSPPRGYYRASDVLPEELAQRAFSHLGTPGKITFGNANRPNRSEESLPLDLVHEIRAELDRQRINTKRTIYFGPSTSRVEGAKELAAFLAAMRFPLAAIADAVGVAYWTIRRWGIGSAPKRRKIETLSLADREAFYAAGLVRCNEVRDTQQQSPSPNHCIYVGWCLASLKD